ncbi:MAG: Gfo/Idh/MocA family oxidoreductase [Thermomicrobiales bacterium]
MRIGIVGAGFMGRSYAQIINAHPLVELAGVADVNRETAAKVADTLGVPAFRGIEEMIAAGPLDGAIVATSEDAHREPCLAAFAAGAGVLVEKPLTTTIADAEAIIAAAEAAGKPLLVGHVLHFDARYAQLADAVRAGAIGEPLTIYARRLNGIAAQDRLQGRCPLTLFLGVHDYDVARWVAGSEVTEVVARERRGFLASRGAEVEDAVIALLTFANGVLATIEEGWILPNSHPTGFDQRLDVNGSTGRIELVGHESGVVVMDEDRLSWPDTQLWPTIHGEVEGALRRETWHFIDCLYGKATPMVTGADGLAALRIALAVAQSARTGEAVRL